MDVVNLLSQDTIGTVTGSGKKVVISDGGGWNPFTMRVDQAPFNDVRVGRPFGSPSTARRCWRPCSAVTARSATTSSRSGDPEYDHSIPQRQYDPEQAKSLLKAAGPREPRDQLVTGDIAQGVVNMAEVYAQQAAAAGINVKLRTSRSPSSTARTT